MGADAQYLIGRWVTDKGNDLHLRARPGSGYASIWLTRCGRPWRIGSVTHTAGEVHALRWEPPWRDQTPAWKTWQRDHAAALLAAWHTRGCGRASLPPDLIGTFDVDGGQYALVPVVDDHAVLAAVGAAGLAPVADLLHDQGRLCALVPRPDWRFATEERWRQWRAEAAAALAAPATPAGPAADADARPHPVS